MAISKILNVSLLRLLETLYIISGSCVRLVLVSGIKTPVYVLTVSRSLGLYRSEVTPVAA